jgi:hypothetical protein
MVPALVSSEQPLLVGDDDDDDILTGEKEIEKPENIQEVDSFQLKGA